MLAAIGVWLWPIGVGGRMPVGGDVTQFALGPLSVLSRSLRSGRLPLWNDLWGYGFPGIGESQMGVYYPPHWVFYGLLPLETGFTASLVLHTFWGGLGAYFACRRFGASDPGAALGGFAFASCGFFFIHLPHHWASTTGSWLPWAWGLAWSVLRGEGRARDPYLLAVVLTLQLLPGHFQLAFCTQVGVLVLAAAQTGESLAAGSTRVPGLVKTLAALGSSFLLSAMQVWPTLRLARLVGGRRDFEYLSGFAASPLHLVTFLTPGLFEISPLWRPVVWDPFHTSPEEYLGFIGVVPLFLALGAVGTGVRRSAGVRALSAVAVVTVLLGLGPYVPGFRFLCATPGFSFFRAPARWFLPASFALCALAATGLDGVGHWRRPGRAILRFVVVGTAIPVLVLLSIETAIASTSRPGWPTVAALYARTLDALPWHEPSAFVRMVRAADRPFVDHRVEEAWARQGVSLKAAPRPVFAGQRLAIYRQELTASVLVFGVLLGLATLGDRGRLKAGLVALAFFELLWLGRQRRIDLGPVAPLAAQSPILERLARAPRGQRTMDPLRNMPMVVGSAPVSAYRTLDLPALGSLTALAGELPVRGRDPGPILGAIRAAGVGVRVFDPGSVQELDRQGSAWPGPLDRVNDPTLAGWLLGKDWVAQQGGRATTFGVGRVPGIPARGWLVPLTGESRAAILGVWSGNPSRVLDALRGAAPLDVLAADAGHREVRFRCDGPALVVLSELADPQWHAGFVTPGGARRPTPLLRAFGRSNQGAWQAVQVSGRGNWTLRLRYRAYDVEQGLAVSGAAWTLLAWLWLRRGRGPELTIPKERGNPS